MSYKNTVQAVLRRTGAPVAEMQFVIRECTAATGALLPCGRFVLNLQATAVNLGLSHDDGCTRIIVYFQRPRGINYSRGRFVFYQERTTAWLINPTTNIGNALSK